MPNHQTKSHENNYFQVMKLLQDNPDAISLTKDAGVPGAEIEMLKIDAAQTEKTSQHP